MGIPTLILRPPRLLFNYTLCRVTLNRVIKRIDGFVDIQPHCMRVNIYNHTIHQPRITDHMRDVFATHAVDSPHRWFCCTERSVMEFCALILWSYFKIVLNTGVYCMVRSVYTSRHAKRKYKNKKHTLYMRFQARRLNWPAYASSRQYVVVN